MQNKKKLKISQHFKGISLRWDNAFIRNIIIVTGVILVWRGAWNLMDMYIFPGNELFSNIFSILLGILVLYLPDSTIKELGEYEKTQKK